MFGAFAPCPLRCTANSAIHGWTATQQSRMAADAVVSWRSMPLAVMTVEVGASAVTLISYHGRNGVGAAHAPTLTYTSATQPCLAEWELSYEDDLGNAEPWAIRQAIATIQWSSSGAVGVSVRQTPPTVNGVDLVASSGITTPYRVTITVYGDWGPARNIGDYGGDLNKRDNATEAEVPYAAQWYRELHASRGSAYTQLPYTLVDFENLAIARMLSASFSRNAEKLEANSVPGRADERLGYWKQVLGIPAAPSDPKWLIRQRCATHYQAATGPTLDTVTAALESLLGDAFVELHTYYGVDLDNPPIPTYWPAGTHGPASFSIGGAPWMSRRCHLRIEVRQTPGTTLPEFLELMNVQMQQLLDRMLPAWVTWNWSQGSDGFQIGVDNDQIGIDAL